MQQFILENSYNYQKQNIWGKNENVNQLCDDQIVKFLVADTQLYKSLCPSVRPSVGWSVRVEKCENAHFSPCPPVRNWYGRVSGLVSVSIFLFDYLHQYVRIRSNGTTDGRLNGRILYGIDTLSIFLWCKDSSTHASSCKNNFPLICIMQLAHMYVRGSFWKRVWARNFTTLPDFSEKRKEIEILTAKYQNVLNYSEIHW